MEVKVKKLKNGTISVWYKFHANARAYTGTLRGMSEREARKHITQEKARVESGKSLHTGKAPRLRDFINEVYLPWAEPRKRSSDDDKRIALVIAEELGDFRLNEIGSKRIRQFQTTRLATPTPYDDDRSHNTVNRELSVCSSIFRLAVAEELITHNPCKGVSPLPRGESVVRFLSHDEHERLLAHLHDERLHLRPAVLVALYTGMRRSEQFTLCRRQIDFEAGLIRLERTKTRRARVVPMNGIVEEIMLELCEGKEPDEAVFSSPHPKHKGKPYSEPKRAFNKACELAEIADFSWHCLRHTFGTWCAMAGIDVTIIQKLMGHTDIRTTMIYVHIASLQTKEAVTQLESWREWVVAEKSGKKTAKKKDLSSDLKSNIIDFKSFSSMDQRRIELLTSALRMRRAELDSNLDEPSLTAKLA
jgi:integrase